MHHIALLFAGAFLCNGIPHLVSGLQGRPFPTPFATPRGVGDSSPVVNFLWGALNLLIGLWLLSDHPVTIGLNLRFLALIVGALTIGLFLALHFDKVQRGRR